MKLKAAKLEEQLWEDIKHEVQAVDPAFFSAIEEFEPKKKHILYKASYPYGADILKEGLIQLPLPNGEVGSIDHPDLPQRVRDAFGSHFYGNTLGLVLKNAVEVFFLREGMIVSPFGILKAGDLFGASMILNGQSSHHPRFLWNITAGSRSLFMLPKISENLGFQKLKKTYTLEDQAKPNSFLDHWSLFRDLANQPDFGEDWVVEVLFFPKVWLDWTEKRSHAFRLALFENAWKATDFNRNQYIWDLIFSVFQAEKIVRGNPYALDALQYLIMLGVGAQSAFMPALNNQSAPISHIQAVFREVYKIEYAPIIMELETIYNHRGGPLYCALDYPTRSEFSPNNRRVSTKIADLSEIQILLKKFLNFMKKTDIKLWGSIVEDLHSDVSFDFFHQHSKDHPDFLPIEQIFEADPHFTQAAGSFDLPLPLSAPFLNGCIRVKRVQG